MMAEPIHPKHQENNLFQLALSGYLAEASYLSELAESTSFRTLLEMFESYRTFLGSGRDYFGESSFNTLLNKNIIDFSKSTDTIQKLIRCINLAAACDLFEGWTIPVNNFDNKHLRDYVYESIRELKEKQNNIGSLLAAKLNSGDACSGHSHVKNVWLDSTRHDHNCSAVTRCFRRHQGSLLHTQYAGNSLPTS